VRSEVVQKQSRKKKNSRRLQGEGERWELKPATKIAGGNRAYLKEWKNSKGDGRPSYVVGVILEKKKTGKNGVHGGKGPKTSSKGWEQNFQQKNIRDQFGKNGVNEGVLGGAGESRGVCGAWGRPKGDPSQTHEGESLIKHTRWRWAVRKSWVKRKGAKEMKNWAW